MGKGFFNQQSFREKKRTSAHLDNYDPIIAAITSAFQDKKIVKKISDLVGFEKNQIIIASPF